MKDSASSELQITEESFYFVAVIEKGTKEGVLKVCQNGLSEWINVPLDMIDKAKIVGTASGNGNEYKVALIKFKEPKDSLTKVAFQLLTQMHSAISTKASDKDCECNETKNNSKDPNSKNETALRKGVLGGLGRFGGLGIFGCEFQFKCYDCTRCIPFTDLCFPSTCCDLVAVKCSI
ncbi:hypothetical protein MBM09_05390 [Flaviramulus sp. BrNp1-15]|uniref:hypothetical protein n=1 Tax=Flaviramulus sp. BrNp1-15 TaxID=2916754 RepID=UPI001EE908BD|nr:hypothetical protein [Flaviramulus sp. BrNp1-15]ULC60420.1 hypothetical protein MBM09_05390 [Flaviramulus sp. BrNp1-15]